MNKMDHTHKTIVLEQKSNGMPIQVTIIKDTAFSARMRLGPVIFNVLPQIVIWTEDSLGQLMETVYITGADFKKMRHAGKNKKGALFFSECFPVWASRVKAAGKELPSKEKPYTDAVTSATPQSSFTVQTRLRQAVKTQAEVKELYPNFNWDKYMSNIGLDYTGDINVRQPNFFAEINKSGDLNAVYNKENNDWVGQPSIVYSVKVPEIQPGLVCSLHSVGHGGKIQDPPAIYSDLSDFDTALKQVRAIAITFQ